jgi:carbon-monoxide dehydrogenase large subunit
VAIGRSIPAREAARLVRSGGVYLDDLDDAGCLHAVFVRSPVGHALVTAVDVAAAGRAPGVRGVFHEGDLENLGAGRIRVGWCVPGQRSIDNPLLAGDRARYAGEPLAVVLADDRYLAEDAAALVDITYEPRAAVTTVEHALAAGTELLYPEWGDNVLARMTLGSGEPDAHFAGAAHLVRDRFHVGRASGVPMETRSAMARPDPLTGRLDVYASVQSTHHVRAQLADVLGCSESEIRVVAPDVGGSFGVKDHLAPEIATVALLAHRLGLAVKWVEDRGEHLAACPQSREQVWDVELAADAEARILAVRGTLWFDAGAHSGAHGIGTAVYSASLLPGPYALADYRLEVIGVVTNKAPSAAYRGYGGPEAAFVIEGLVDRLARRTGLDPAEVRRRNIIPPDRFPYTNAAGIAYDVADHRRVLDMALEAAGYDELRSERQPGSGRGVGIACVVQPGGFGPSRAAVEAGMAYGGFETAAVRMDATGRATVLTGLTSQGQGVTTALAQVCAEVLGVDAERDVTVIAGDTAVTPFSPVGAIASRGATVGGGAVSLAASELAEKLRSAAQVRLEAAAGDIELRDGVAAVRGSPGEEVPIAELAAAVTRGELLPDGVPPGLDAVATYEPSGETVSYGAHVAIVRVDSGTGDVVVERYVCVTDCGTLINPAIVEGQIAGAVAQGIGGALYEEFRYADDGSALTFTLSDYRLPTAVDVPRIDARFVETPTPVTPTGARGAGEIGINGPAAAIANAIADALGPECGHPDRTPFTPERVWQLIHGEPG